jgi:hypothetical protein
MNKQILTAKQIYYNMNWDKLSGDEKLISLDEHERLMKEQKDEWIEKVFK